MSVFVYDKNIGVEMDTETIHNLSVLGMTRKMIALYYGMTVYQFNKYCEMFPVIENAFSKGVVTGLNKGIS